MRAAEPRPSAHAGRLKQRLEKLNVLGSVLYFAAHPDDENTRLISWLANERDYRTGYLSLTRGDGGQNLIGTEQGEELGLLRTQELLAARRIDGGEQYFSTANDFGFSKTYDETFEIWNKEKILADAVWVIRKFRPDIIITRFPPDPRAGHGHHQASAIVAQEAFIAAADPTKFPEQLKYVAPWQAKRLLWNTFNFMSGGNTIDSAQFNVAIDQYNSLLGQSYGEIAANSRTMHKSQGFGSTPRHGQMREYFELLAGEALDNDLFDGINTTWSRIQGASFLQQEVDKINHDFDIKHPEKTVPQLVTLLTKVEHLEASYWTEQKAKEIKELILDCSGIWIQSATSIPKYAIGDTVDIETNIVVQQPGINAKLLALHVNNSVESDLPAETLSLDKNKIVNISTRFYASSLTQPYWLNSSHGIGSFNVTDQKEIGNPESLNLPHTIIDLQIEGKSISFRRNIEYHYTDPVRGEVTQPVSIAPMISINIPQKALVFNGREPKAIEVLMRANKANVNGKMKAVLPSGWKAEPALIAVNLVEEDDESVHRIVLYPPADAKLEDTLSFAFDDVMEQIEKKAVMRSLRTIAYDHIPKITWFPEAKIRLSKVETGVSAKRIGYLPGAGDLVPQSLRAIGLIVDILNDEEVLNKDLSVYDAIVTGVRIYNVNERMRYLQPKLFQYVNEGGTLVQQYNVSNGLKLSKLGPYPFQIGRDRVTEETAPVKIQNPESEILNYPNKITDADFDGWVQERGLYFASDIASDYDAPLIMNDKGEQANSGSLLVAQYGKGKFVYTSLAFFRQLPAGVPGAYRLFVNLLANKNIN